MIKGDAHLILNGKIIIAGKLVRESSAEDGDEAHSFRDKLEKCLIDLCYSMEIPVPLWLKKNTRELAIFRKTFFTPEQFMEKVWFDRFEIKLG